jgi:hypothetical protein
MLSRLEKKGFLRHTEEGLRYIYSATTSPPSAKKTALQQYLQTFFGGSLAQMVTALVRHVRPEDLSPSRRLTLWTARDAGVPHIQATHVHRAWHTTPAHGTHPTLIEQPFRMVCLHADRMRSVVQGRPV